MDYIVVYNIDKKAFRIENRQKYFEQNSRMVLNKLIIHTCDIDMALFNTKEEANDYIINMKDIFDNLGYEINDYKKNSLFSRIKYLFTGRL